MPPFFVDILIGMGARIILCDPHRAVIVGPSPLHGQELSSPDIRAGMALLIAAALEENTSTIANVGQIDTATSKSIASYAGARHIERANV